VNANHHHDDDEQGGVSNGTFVSWVAVVSILITICGGLIVWVYNLNKQVDDWQNTVISEHTKILAERGERITADEGRMNALEQRISELERTCRPASGSRQ